MSFYSALDKASLEALSSDPSSPGNGRIYLNTTTGPKWYFGGLWRTALDQGSSQSMSNKTSTNLRISDYVEFAETSAPSTPSAGYSRVYFKTDGKAYKKNSAGVETDLVEGTSGSGSGEINVIENPSAASDITGWVASAAGITVVRTTTASDLPLEGPVDSAIKITPVSGTDYVRYRWTMPAALKNKKLKLEWHQRPLSGYASGDLKVEVYKNSASDYTGSYTEFSLSTDSSGTSAIPNATGKYTTYYEADDADYYELRIVRVAGTTALNITNVISGPGIQPQGAVVGGWQSYSPTVAGLGTGSATATAFYRRNGWVQWLRFISCIYYGPKWYDARYFKGSSQYCCWLWLFLRSYIRSRSRRTIL